MSTTNSSTDGDPSTGTSGATTTDTSADAAKDLNRSDQGGTEAAADDTEKMNLVALRRKELRRKLSRENVFDNDDNGADNGLGPGVTNTEDASDADAQATSANKRHNKRQKQRKTTNIILGTPATTSLEEDDGTQEQGGTEVLASNAGNASTTNPSKSMGIVASRRNELKRRISRENLYAPLPPSRRQLPRRSGSAPAGSPSFLQGLAQDEDSTNEGDTGNRPYSASPPSKRSFVAPEGRASLTLGAVAAAQAAAQAFSVGLLPMTTLSRSDSSILETKKRASWMDDMPPQRPSAQALPKGLVASRAQAIKKRMSDLNKSSNLISSIKATSTWKPTSACTDSAEHNPFLQPRKDDDDEDASDDASMEAVPPQTPPPPLPAQAVTSAGHPGLVQSMRQQVLQKFTQPVAISTYTAPDTNAGVFRENYHSALEASCAAIVEANYSAPDTANAGVFKENYHSALEASATPLEANYSAPDTAHAGVFRENYHNALEASATPLEANYSHNPQPLQQQAGKAKEEQEDDFEIGLLQAHSYLQPNANGTHVPSSNDATADPMYHERRDEWDQRGMQNNGNNMDPTAGKKWQPVRADQDAEEEVAKEQPKVPKKEAAPKKKSTTPMDQDTAARVIQQFLQEATDILLWHKEEMAYWEEEKQDIERRKQEELEDVQRYEQLEKRQFLAQLEELDDNDGNNNNNKNEEWNADWQWVQTHKHQLAQERRKRDSLRGSMRRLSHMNKKMTMDPSSETQDQLKWMDITLGMQLAKKRLGGEIAKIDRAARRIQRFMQDVTPFLSMYHEELIYWNEEREDIEKRRKEEMQDIQMYLMLEKQQIQAEVQAEFGGGQDNDDDDWTQQWASDWSWLETNKAKLDKEKKTKKKLNEGIRQLVRDNKQLGIAGQREEGKAKDAQEQVNALLKEQKKWTSQSNALELATKELKAVIASLSGGSGSDQLLVSNKSKSKPLKSNQEGYAEAGKNAITNDSEATERVKEGSSHSQNTSSTCSDSSGSGHDGAAGVQGKEKISEDEPSRAEQEADADEDEEDDDEDEDEEAPLAGEDAPKEEEEEEEEGNSKPKTDADKAHKSKRNKPRGGYSWKKHLKRMHSEPDMSVDLDLDDLLEDSEDEGNAEATAAVIAAKSDDDDGGKKGESSSKKDKKEKKKKGKAKSNDDSARSWQSNPQWMQSAPLLSLVTGDDDLAQPACPPLQQKAVIPVIEEEDQGGDKAATKSKEKRDKKKKGKSKSSDNNHHSFKGNSDWNESAPLLSLVTEGVAPSMNESNLSKASAPNPTKVTSIAEENHKSHETKHTKDKKEKKKKKRNSKEINPQWMESAPLLSLVTGGDGDSAGSLNVSSSSSLDVPATDEKAGKGAKSKESKTKEKRDKKKKGKSKSADATQGNSQWMQSAPLLSLVTDDMGAALLDPTASDSNILSGAGKSSSSSKGDHKESKEERKKRHKLPPTKGKSSGSDKKGKEKEKSPGISKSKTVDGRKSHGKHKDAGENNKSESPPGSHKRDKVKFDVDEGDVGKKGKSNDGTADDKHKKSSKKSSSSSKHRRGTLKRNDSAPSLSGSSHDKQKHRRKTTSIHASLTSAESPLEGAALFSLISDDREAAIEASMRKTKPRRAKSTD